MSNETKTYYLIKKNDGTKVAVEMLHLVCNKFAAKKALMAAFNLKESDLQLESGGNPVWARTNAYIQFDGRNAH